MATSETYIMCLYLYGIPRYIKSSYEIKIIREMSVCWWLSLWDDADDVVEIEK